MLSRQNGFTLLEICLALMIGLLLITLAVPSVMHAMAEQRLRRSFETFDTFVQDIRMRSIREQHDLVMRWDEKSITVAAASADQYPADKDDAAAPETFVFDRSDHYTLARPAALKNDPMSEWTFWKSGVCEPAEISFHGTVGKWLVRYDALTGRGVFLESGVE